MFRVSPWIPYDPTADGHGDSSGRHKTNEDVDMDAPQISTLPEEQTPEPQPSPSRTGKFRVKLVMSEPKRTVSTASSSARKPSERGGSGDEEDDDEEEDQLIDDDDDEARPAPPPVVSAPPPTTTRGTGRGRGAGTGRGRGRGRGRGGKLARTDSSQSVAPGPSTEGVATITIPPASISAPLTTAKKTRGVAKVSTRGTRGKRGRGGTTKATIPSHLRDDGGSVSEGMSVPPLPHIVPYIHNGPAYTPTVASTPPRDELTPEIHEAPLPPPALSIAPSISTEEINLEGVPVPLYPLPSKPFPVQPPPKIGAAFAPALQLDKSGKRVRHWRQANREIRGVAGGRWFTKTWIGDKESDYASHVAAVADKATGGHTIADREVLMSGSIPIPRLSGTSTRGRPKGFKTDSHLGTNPPSRAHSTGADSISASTSNQRTNISVPADTPLAVSTPAPA